MKKTVRFFGSGSMFLMALLTLMMTHDLSASNCGSPTGTVVNMTTHTTATVNGAILNTSTGEGVTIPVIRLASADNCEQGYNSSLRLIRYDENTTLTYNHDLLLTDVPTVSIGGVHYREFVLRINQSSPSLISLEEIQIFQTDSVIAKDLLEDWTSSAKLVWSLDGDSDRYILLDYNLNATDTVGDMLLDVPSSLFDTDSQYVVIYSRFGDHNNNNDGYEQWSVKLKVNHCPVAEDLSKTVEQDASATFPLVGSDPDDDHLDYLVTVDPTHGVLVLNTQTGAATYIPNTGYTGSDEFKYEVSDGQCPSEEATVSITVAEPVSVDIRPRTCPNPLNITDQGFLPVAIAGSSFLDVNQIDPATITLEGVSPSQTGVEDVTAPTVPYTGKSDCSDCSSPRKDKVKDLTLKFSVPALIGALGSVADEDCRVLHLAGNLLDGTAIIGEDVVKIMGSVAKISGMEAHVETFTLFPSYPNPFNPVTEIRYAIPARNHVTLKIYNALGQEIETLVDEVQDAAQRTVRWDATRQPSGVYFCRLTAGNYTSVQKLILTK